MSFATFTGAGEYNEYRQHELRKRRLVMVDGNLMANDSNHLVGQSARVYQNGYWGFAAATEATNDLFRVPVEHFDWIIVEDSEIPLPASFWKQAYTVQEIVTYAIFGL